jgi:hypothetical protein
MIPGELIYVLRNPYLSAETMSVTICSQIPGRETHRSQEKLIVRCPIKPSSGETQSDVL